MARDRRRDDPLWGNGYIASTLALARPRTARRARAMVRRGVLGAQYRAVACITVVPSPGISERKL